MTKFQLILLGLTLSAFLVACGGNATQSGTDTQNEATQTEAVTQTDQQEEQSPEYTSAYICPMHCKGSGSDQPGTCPSCGMDYVKNADYKNDADGNGAGDHDHDHEGHSH